MFRYKHKIEFLI